MELEIIDVVNELEEQLKNELEYFENYNSISKTSKENKDKFWQHRQDRKLFTKAEITEIIRLSEHYESALMTRNQSEYTIQMIRAMLGRLYILME